MADVAACLGCGYSLSGLSAGGLCPECGLSIPDPAKTVLLYGTAKNQETVVWRQVVWVVLGLYGFVFSQGFFYAMTQGYLWAVVFAGFVLVASLIAMLMTGTAKKTAVECFAFTTAGLGRSSPKGDEGARSFQPWRGHVVVEMPRVGAMWSKLKVFEFTDGERRVMLEAGVRCPDAAREWVLAATNEVANAERSEELVPEAAPPTDQ